jgi:hypothetical protein
MDQNSPPNEIPLEHRKAIFKALEEEQTAIRDSIGDASIAWSALESTLSATFHTLAFGERNVETAGVIFYTPGNFEGRLALVDNLMTYHFEVKALPMTYMPQMHTLWRKLKGRIDSKKNRRNAIIHGTVTHLDAGNLRRRTVRLTPAFLDVLRLHPSRASGQYAGMSSNDVKQFSRSVVRLNDFLTDFLRLLRRYKKGREHPDSPILRDPEMLEAIAQLGKKLNSQNEQEQATPNKRPRK